MNKDIAIIWIDINFPKAKTVDELWHILVNDVQAWDQTVHWVTCDIDNRDTFDYEFFNFSRKEAESLDNHQKKFLESCWRVLESSWYSKNRKSKNIWIYWACGFNSQFINNYSRNKETNFLDSNSNLQTMINNDKDYLSTRVSYKLDLTGPAMTIQTACSSSLVAVHQAINWLLLDDCKTAIAGWICLLTPAECSINIEEDFVISKTWQCKPFDKDADGAIFSSWCGTILLKKLEEAQKDGDYIWWVIKASHINNDGSEKMSFAAPSIHWQEILIKKTLEKANLALSDVSYIETHGTATKIWDMIEISAIKNIIKQNYSENTNIYLGSIKGNIWHLSWASWIAWIVKVLLCIKNKIIVKSWNFTSINPLLGIEKLWLSIADQNIPWDKERLIAWVSSFGIWWTNCHIIIENYIPKDLPHSDKTTTSMFSLSLKNSEDTEKYKDSIKEILHDKDLDEIEKVTRNMNIYKEQFSFKGAFVYQNKQDFFDELDKIAFQHSKNQREIIFIFPWQWSQYSKMGKNLYHDFAPFKEKIDEIHDYVLAKYGIELLNLLFEDTREDENIFITHITLFSIEVAYAELLRAIDIKPTQVLWHSLGEYAAAHIAWILSLEDAIDCVMKRGELFKSISDNWGMLVIFSSQETIQKILKNREINTIDIGVINSANQIVLSGDKTDLETVEKILLDQNISFKYSKNKVAGHSRYMNCVKPEYLNFLDTITFNSPSINFLIPKKEISFLPHSKEYWSEQITDTVDFYSASQRIKDAIIIECWPRNFLSSSIRENHDTSNILFDGINPKNQEVEIYKTITWLYNLGIEINFEKIYHNSAKYPLIPYPFYNIVNNKNGIIKFFQVKYEETIQTSHPHHDRAPLLARDSIFINLSDEAVMIEGYREVLKEDFMNQDYFSSRVILYFDKNNLNTHNYFELSKLIERIYHFGIYEITIVTKNWIYFNNDTTFNKNNSPILGIIRVARLEFRSISISFVDIESSGDIEKALRSSADKTNYDLVIRDNKWFEIILDSFDLSKSNFEIQWETILLVGGNWGIWFELLKRLTPHNNIIVLSRSWLNFTQKSFLKTNWLLEKVVDIIWDVTQPEDVGKLFKTYTDIDRIFFLVGTLDDRLIINQDYNSFSSVFFTKVKGINNIIKILAQQQHNVSNLTIFSSVVSVLWNIWQVNHAAANMYLDQIWTSISSKIKTQVINWWARKWVGAINEEKLEKSIEKKWFQLFDYKTWEEALKTLLSSPFGNIVFSPVCWDNYLKQYPESHYPHSLKRFIERWKSSVVSDKIQQNEPDSYSTENKIQNILQEILWVQIKKDDNIFNYGLDSLSTMEFIYEMKKKFWVDIPMKRIYELKTSTNILDAFQFDTAWVSSPPKNTPLQKNTAENYDNLWISTQQQRWIKLIELDYGQRVVPIEFNNRLDKESFIKALTALVERHNSLRRYFPNTLIQEAPIENIIPTDEKLFYDFSEIDISLHKKAIDEIVLHLFETMWSPNEKISRGIKCLTMEKNSFIVLLSLQHLDFDGISLSIFAEEFNTLYIHYLLGKKNTLENEVVQYNEYIHRQKNYKEHDIEGDRSFFKDTYNTLTELTLLPNHSHFTMGTPMITSKYYQPVLHGLADKIYDISKKLEVSAFALLLWVYSTFIAELVYSKEVTIATIVNGRPNVKFRNTIGPFTQPFPLRIQLKWLSLEEVIEQCHRNIIDINSKSHYPVGDLINTINVFKDLPMETYFSDVGINFTNYKKNSEKENSEYKIFEILWPISREEFSVFHEIEIKRIPWLHLVINETENNLAFTFYYHSQRFTSQEVKKWADRYMEILMSIIENQ